MILSFFLRLKNLDYPIQNTDPHRDYLIARHIAYYREFPVSGPANSIFWYAGNSPFYYYLLAGFTRLRDSFMLLSAVNLVLQLLAGYLLYLAGKKLFGQGAGLIGAAFYLLSGETITYSTHVWQPFFVPVFIHGSVLALAHAFDKKSSLAAILSIFLFFAAAAMHLSVISLIPVFLIAVFLTARRFSAKWIDYLNLFLAFAASFLFFFGPMILHFFHYRDNILSAAPPHGILTQGYRIFFQKIIGNLKLFGKILFPHYSLLGLGLMVPLFILFSRKRMVGCLLLAAIAMPILSSSLFGKTAETYYYAGIVGLFFLLLGAAFGQVFSGNLPRAAVGIVAMAILVQGANPSLASDFRNNFRFLESPFYGDPAVAAVAKQVRALAAETNNPDYRFFQVLVFRQNTASEVYNAYFINGLEKKLQSQLVTVPAYSLRAYEDLNDDKYLFMVCQYDDPLPAGDELCSEAPSHRVMDIVYRQYPFIIYLLVRD